MSCSQPSSPYLPPCLTLPAFLAHQGTIHFDLAASDHIDTIEYYEQWPLVPAMPPPQGDMACDGSHSEGESSDGAKDMD